MRALTVKQPWAWAIIYGGKDVENRAQMFGHRGLVAIHAAKVDDDGGYGDARILRALDDVTTVTSFASTALRQRAPEAERLVRGAVVGVADLVAAHSRFCPADCSPWAERGQTHLRLRNPRALVEPVPARGALGIWTLPDDVAAAVRRQLGGAS